MPGIRISAALKAKLPPDEVEGIEDFLWDKSGEVCFLCGASLNRAADSIEADHDEPDVEGGPTSRVNLNLVHASCNRAKGASPSMDVRPYLRLTTFIRAHGGLLKYGDVLPHFEISPKPSVVNWNKDTASFELPDGRKTQTAIYHESNAEESYAYTFIELPEAAIFNDDGCQPRNIKLSHVWAIYSDLHRNPLHEPPGCRLIAGPKGKVQISMFDGQHKTIASWMMGRHSIVAKVYLDLNQAETIELVNSVQAKIKKLPLSPFELAAKLSDEWRNKLDTYQSEVGVDTASEAGFLRWLPRTERARGTSAFRAALVQNLLSAEDLQLRKFVRLAGGPNVDGIQLTENQLKSKVLERMIHMEALEEKAEDAEILRARERDNILRSLNAWTDLVFPSVAETEDLSEQAKERMRRMTYQSSLQVIADLIRALHGHVLAIGGDRELLEKEPTEEQWRRIQDGIRRIVDHPVWTADFGISDKMKAINDALSKNQDAERAFGSVGLKLGYVVGADQLPDDCLR